MSFRGATVFFTAVVLTSPGFPAVAVDVPTSFLLVEPSTSSYVAAKTSGKTKAALLAELSQMQYERDRALYLWHLSTLDGLAQKAEYNELKAKDDRAWDIIKKKYP